MKKSIITILAVCLIGSSIIADNSANKKDVNVDDQISTLKASINKLNMENYRNEADELSKKADYEAHKGHNELADAYRKCADAKYKIANGYEQGNQELIDRGNEEYYNENRNLKKVKKEFDKQMSDIKAKFEGIAAKYDNITKQYKEKASEAYKDGNKKLYFIYEGCAEAQKDIADGVKEAIDGRCRYIKAVEVYNEFARGDKLTVSKILIPKGIKRTQEYVNKLMEESQYYSKKSQETLAGNSNAQLTLAYNQISVAKQAEAAGLSKIIAGRQDLNRLKKKLETYNQGQTQVKSNSK